MTFLFLLFPLFLLLGFLLVASVLLRLLKSEKTDEPVRLPANLGWSLLIAVAGLNIFAYDVGPGIGYGVAYIQYLLVRYASVHHKRAVHTIGGIRRKQILRKGQRREWLSLSVVGRTHRAIHVRQVDTRHNRHIRCNGV